MHQIALHLDNYNKPKRLYCVVREYHMKTDDKLKTWLKAALVQPDQTTSQAPLSLTVGGTLVSAIRARASHVEAANDEEWQIQPLPAQCRAISRARVVQFPITFAQSSSNHPPRPNLAETRAAIGIGLS
ncbi:hypothetical protein [Chitiniphilus eburneus]|uniref:hypothetical protein n=1 Tax=Chitiniphilus eburneus TaxID=2571148 RepID=UPI0035CFC14D